MKKSHTLSCPAFFVWKYSKINFNFLRALNHIATINESTSKAVKMYKAFDDEMEHDERQSETPLLFIIGDKLKGEEENGFDEKKLKKPQVVWEDNKTKKRTKIVKLF